LLYNGREYDHFLDVFHSSEPELFFPIKIIDQTTQLQDNPSSNPYHFWPRGVWWKWIPFRLDLNKHEIAVDTDIVCIDEPKTWYNWLDSTDEIVVAPERYKENSPSTVGDFADHPILRGKVPYNCGIVGQHKGINYADRFFEITQEVDFGSTHNSLFITEQGVVNVWLRSLALEGVRYHCLNPVQNAWVRDFLYFMEKGHRVETIHAVAWHKDIMNTLSEVLENRIRKNTPDKDFLKHVIECMIDAGFYQKYILARQLGSQNFGTEFLLSKTSF